MGASHAGRQACCSYSHFQPLASSLRTWLQHRCLVPGHLLLRHGPGVAEALRGCSYGCSMKSVYLGCQALVHQATSSLAWPRGCRSPVRGWRRGIRVAGFTAGANSRNHPCKHSQTHYKASRKAEKLTTGCSRNILSIRDAPSPVSVNSGSAGACVGFVCATVCLPLYYGTLHIRQRGGLWKC